MSWESERQNTSHRIPSTPSVSFKKLLIFTNFYALFDHNTVDQENSEHAVCVIASKSFAAVQTESGKVDILILL